MNKNYLESLIFESTKQAISEVLPSEKERQDRKSKEMSQFRAEQDKEAPADEGEDTPVKKKKSDLPSIDIATIEDKLNTVRAGKSLDDKGVRKQLKLYLQNLNKDDAFYTFKDLTLLPYHRDLIDVNLLTAIELDWINQYHQYVAATLIPRLSLKEQIWLRHMTQPIELE